MKTLGLRICVSALAGLLISGALGAAVLETKTLTRTEDPMVLKGTSLPGYYGLQVNNADVTLAPNQIFVWAYDSATGWRQVVFQIDEINNAYPTSPPPVTTGNCHYGRGSNHMDADDGLWDANDELVFMSGETGDRVSLDEWAPGAVNTAPRYEIVVTDPLDATKKGWVYIFRYDSLPAWRLDDYVGWNATTDTISALDYSVDYPDAHTSAVYFTNLNVTAAGGGTGANLVQKSRLYWYGGFALSCGSDETQIRTSQTITGGSCGDYSLPWYAKDGRVRVLRYFIWSPNCIWVSNGIGMWPSTHIYYYRSFWREDSHVNFHGGSGHTDYWWSSVNHANTTPMTFYDSNAETFPINGTADTFANTPLWTWYQVSSAYGSYVQVLRDTLKEVSPDNRRNLYTESTTVSRGDAGYRIDNPTENAAEPDKWHQFYFFFLPANSPNMGTIYNGYVNAPLGSASTSQNYSIPPQNFDGVLSTTDVNGACVDQGLQISWDNVLTWNDGCSAACTNRHFAIYRDGIKVWDEYNLTLSTWLDLTGTNSQTYAYGVEACNQNANCTALGATLPGVDYVSNSPALASGAVTAADHDACVGDGVDLTWIAPSDWKDNGAGARRFDLYWEVDGYAAPILVNVVSPLLYDAADGVSHQYRVRAVNGCDLFTNYTVSAAVTDQVSAVPTLPANPQVIVNDLSACSLSGVQVSWNPVAGWGDNGNGSRGYDIYWSRNGYATPIAINATSPVTITPPDSAPATYRVVARNGCARSSPYTDGIGADAQTAPAFAGVQSVSDGNMCGVSPVTIAWTDINGNDATGWNDGGLGAFPRIYRIYRNGTEIAGSPVPDGTAFITDQPPLPNTAYTYTVQAVNMGGCFTNGGATLPGADTSGTAPVAVPAQTAAADVDCAVGNGVLISWDAVTDWGDHGVNPSNRRYRIYWSADGYANPIASVPEGTTSFAFNPPDNLPYAYRVVARSGCALSLSYAVSPSVIDKNSCAPSCTLGLNNSFDPTNNFTQICNSKNLWTLTPGVGNGGTQAWMSDLGAAGNKNSYANLRLIAPITIPWITDVKLRFWSSVALAADDAGIVEVWTNDSATWRKIQLPVLVYPVLSATVPASLAGGAGSCATDAGTLPQEAAFQGSWAGAFYEARLDSYLTAATTQVNIGFRAASGATANTSTWIIDDVKIGYGIADAVYWWSLNGSLSQGIVKDGSGTALLSWEDGGLYQVNEFRIYRSGNPANIRTDATSALVFTQTDTAAPSYTWTSNDGDPAAGTSWFYQIYGYKDPCDESNQGEN